MNFSSLLSKHTPFASIGVAFAVTLLGSAPAHAAAYTEVGDAGDLPGTAQVVSAPVTTALTSINGTISVVNNVSEGDMYKIVISSPSTFSATTTNFAPGKNNFDTQLFLFTVAGIGILANDDDPDTGSSQSTIPVGSFTLGAGTYELLITGSGKYPASTAGDIFPNTFDAASDDPTGVYGPTGPGGALPFTTYLGNSSEGGAYSIALTGAQFVTAAVTTVPEPSTIAIFAAGLPLLFLARRRRATLPFSNASVSPL